MSPPAFEAGAAKPASSSTHTNPLIGLWVVVSAFLVAGGWLLSLCHQLNAVGYAVLLLAGAAGLGWWWTAQLKRGLPRRSWHAPRLRRRFRRPLALLFLALAVLAILGGVLHPPNMYDSMTYRVPRLLHWTAEGQWHWIHTVNSRMNTRSCGFEWLAMPLLVLTKSDRAFFVLNAVSFLFLPGLVFSVFTRLGVRPRVAWPWMWFLPTGYSFLLQAGGSANDMFAAPYALAAVDFALRARQSQRFGHVGLSVLAAALATGAKATNLPLLLPWVLALAPSWRLAFSKPAWLAGVGLWAALVSFLPNALLNVAHCGDWSGAALEPHLAKATPPQAFLANLLMLPAQNIVPPFFPLAAWWNHVAPTFLPEGLRTMLGQVLEPGWWRLAELQVEDTAATGLGVMAVLVVSLAWVCGKDRTARASSTSASIYGSHTRLVAWSAWISLLAYTFNASLMAAGRVITPYVPLLLPALLRSPQQARLVRQRWWLRLVLLTGVVAVLVLVLHPARPLWPAQTILGTLRESHPDSRLLVRGHTVYSVYAARHDPLAEVRRLLPPQAGLVGAVLSSDDPETSLWRPFGSRRIVQVLATDTPERVRLRGLEYVVVSPRLPDVTGLTLAEWMTKYQAVLVGQVELRVYASQDKPQPWSVVRLLAK